tara:strand:+ start:14 stop:136 length:123 start_codon:yes stop_codon:yes gene_type:complete
MIDDLIASWHPFMPKTVMRCFVKLFIKISVNFINNFNDKN